MDLCSPFIGVGPTKKECLLEAYNRAWEVLTTSTPEDILTQHKKLNPEDSAGKLIVGQISEIMQDISATSC